MPFCTIFYWKALMRRDFIFSNPIVLLILLILLPMQALADKGPVQVFILGGQSNMVGHGKTEMGLDAQAYKDTGKHVETKGGVGSLRDMVNQDLKTFGHKGTNPLVDAKGDWLVRDDVFIYARVNNDTKKGGHSIAFGKATWIGPEYGLGQAVGNAMQQDVLIIKVCVGGTSLAGDWRPPSAVKKRGGEVGFMWTRMVETTEAVLGDLGKHLPALKGREAEIAGFGWHQGYNDAVTKTYRPEYEQNLVDLIHDVREQFGEPGLPFVIGTTSMWPPEQLAKGRKNNKDKGGTVEQMQQAVANPSKYPQHKGNVVTVDTAAFWQDKSVSPSSFSHHWNHNGTTHYEIGQAMGQAMLELIKNER